MVDSKSAGIVRAWLKENDGGRHSQFLAKLLLSKFLPDYNTDKLPDIIVYLVERGVNALQADLRQENKRQLKVVEYAPRRLTKQQRKQRAYNEAYKERKRQELLAYQQTPEYLAEKEARDREALRVDAFLRFMNNLYMNWTLSDGTKLADATPEVLRREAAREERLADGHSRNAAFYRGLAAQLKDGERVSTIPTQVAYSIRQDVYGDMAEAA